MLRYALTFITLVWCFSANAEIYRWVDQDGHVQFSDRWSQGAEKFAAQKQPNPAVQVPAALQPASPDMLFLGPYTALEILAPAADETLSLDAQGLPVSLMVDPTLIAGHQMAVLLNDTALPVQRAATQFKLTGAALGSHRLQIRITADDGRIVAQSSPHSFHVQKPKEPGQLR